jgi:hypothetical protein
VEREPSSISFLERFFERSPFVVFRLQGREGGDSEEGGNFDGFLEGHMSPIKLWSEDL